MAEKAGKQALFAANVAEGRARSKKDNNLVNPIQHNADGRLQVLSFRWRPGISVTVLISRDRLPDKSRRLAFVISIEHTSNIRTQNHFLLIIIFEMNTSNNNMKNIGLRDSARFISQNQKTLAIKM